MYLRENQKDGSSARYEEVNGLRVLGSLVGNTRFCCDFLDKKMKEAAKDSTKITSCLSDLQTMTRLFSVCTVHKMTHLFDSDVLSSPIEDLPNRYYLWESPMSIKFDAMINDFLCSITNKPQLPDHANIISTMSKRQGGLGLQHSVQRHSSFHDDDKALPPVLTGRSLAGLQQSPSDAQPPNHVPIQQLVHNNFANNDYF